MFGAGKAKVESLEKSHSTDPTPYKFACGFDLLRASIAIFVSFGMKLLVLSSQSKITELIKRCKG